MTKKKKNIVSIEERIPKLKQARKKKANRRLIFYLSIFFILICVIVYVQSPLSNVKNVEITGNHFVTKEDIIDDNNLTDKTNIWTVNKKKIEENLLENDVIKSVEVKRKLPWTVEINLIEHEHVGYIKNGANFHPVLAEGVTLTSYEASIKGDAPLLLGFSEEKYLKNMTAELHQLPSSILDLISEIHWIPTKENQNKIILYMNDGFIVDGTIRDFANKMDIYPSIVSQLDSNKKGIIHLSVGVYFEEFE